ncbi:hypothetical protein H257_12343 [Aphanomyces astaci]|uniref:Protein kinase domain-containing protein n=1 Tax=Aphanomyces astaci TaxID=112090 RepID=W4G003_APHAT|nr:hypothetical protein H257_12343 [Aphanomyces astaci]ETV72581.1 hypothetical protein H257_12343 [Aphanomyces astaci]|eukprot:XP_009837809.1 hypothetical protein H257_12343 [Aphanomyces astaci]
MVCDAANGLSHLHASACLHRDVVVCQHVARTMSKSATLGWHDGDSWWTDGGRMSSDLVTTIPPSRSNPPYLSLYKEASDVFAFGVTMWETYHDAVAVRVSDMHISTSNLEMVRRCFAVNPVPTKADRAMKQIRE